MFGLFSKKRSPADAVIETLDTRSAKGMSNIANLLIPHVLLHRNQPTFEQDIQSRFTRGYLFGFFDAGIQRLSLPASTNEEALIRIVAGHSFLLSDLKMDAIQYVRESARLLDDPAYQTAHSKGVEDLYECLNNPDRKPIGLMGYFLRNGA